MLGLTLRHADDFALVLDANGTPLRLAIVEKVPEHTGTSAGRVVPDVCTTVR